MAGEHEVITSLAITGGGVLTVAIALVKWFASRLEEERKERVAKFERESENNRESHKEIYRHIDEKFEKLSVDIEKTRKEREQCHRDCGASIVEFDKVARDTAEEYFSKQQDALRDAVKDRDEKLSQLVTAINQKADHAYIDAKIDGLESKMDQGHQSLQTLFTTTLGEMQGQLKANNKILTALVESMVKRVDNQNG